METQQPQFSPIKIYHDFKQITKAGLAISVVFSSIAGYLLGFDEEHPFGKEINGFTEESKPNFFGSGYSIVKGFTDQMMHLFPNVLNLRIRMPIIGEPNGRNFITKISTYENTQN